MLSALFAESFKVRGPQLVMRAQSNIVNKNLLARTVTRKEIPARKATGKVVKKIAGIKTNIATAFNLKELKPLLRRQEQGHTFDIEAIHIAQLGTPLLSDVIRIFTELRKEGNQTCGNFLVRASQPTPNDWTAVSIHREDLAHKLDHM